MLSPVGSELQISSDATALGLQQERSIRSNRKASSGAGGTPRGLSAQVGTLGPGERNSGVKVS